MSFMAWMWTIIGACWAAAGLWIWWEVEHAVDGDEDDDGPTQPMGPAPA